MVVLEGGGFRRGDVVCGYCGVCKRGVANMVMFRKVGKVIIQKEGLSKGTGGVNRVMEMRAMSRGRNVVEGRRLTLDWAGRGVLVPLDDVVVTFSGVVVTLDDGVVGDVETRASHRAASTCCDSCGETALEMFFRDVMESSVDIVVLAAKAADGRPD